MTALAQALSAALREFLWQGLAVAFVLWVALLFMKNRSARARYAVCCAALALMAVLPAITALTQYQASGGPPSAVAGTLHVAAGSNSSTVPAHEFDWAAWVDRWALPMWSLGVLLFSLRLVWASRRISMLRKQSQPTDDGVLALVVDLAERIKLTRPVRILMTAAADCPSVVGWFQPAVLLPAAALAGLTPEQLEAVLAHELAHILRYDYLVNMLQTVVETLLFYHPAVWWVSMRIRQERELCCDDVAVEACGDALCYARALTRLERMRLATPTLALGSSGGSLLYRIRRIMGEAREGHAPSKLPGVLALALGLLCFAVNLQWAAHGQQPEVAAQDLAVADTGPGEDGVEVDAGGAELLYRQVVEYPGPAIEKHIEGTVVLEATVDAGGLVSDARVLSGPVELRRAALTSVLEWRFAQDAAGGTRQVTIHFHLPASGVARKRLLRGRVRAGVAGGVRGGVAGSIGEGVGAGVGEGVSGGIGGGVGGGVAAEEELREQKEEMERRVLEEQAEQDRELQALRGEQANLEAKVRALENRRFALAASADEKALQAASAGDLANARLAESFEAQAKTLEKQLMDLRGQAALEHSGAVLADTQRAQMAALEARLAEMQVGRADLHALSLAGKRVRSISIIGLSGPLRDELMAKLPVRVESRLEDDSLERIEAVVKGFDEHLGISINSHNGQVDIRIMAPGSRDRLE